MDKFNTIESSYIKHVHVNNYMQLLLFKRYDSHIGINFKSWCKRCDDFVQADFRDSSTEKVMWTPNPVPIYFISDVFIVAYLQLYAYV